VAANNGVSSVRENLLSSSTSPPIRACSAALRSEYGSSFPSGFFVSAALRAMRLRRSLVVEVQPKRSGGTGEGVDEGSPRQTNALSRML
jgi:hypothetical protein